MDNQFLIKAMAAHHALNDAEAMANPVVFLKRANDALCIIESFADGTLEVMEDAVGNTRFRRRRVEPNTDSATAKEQPLADMSVERSHLILRQFGNDAGAMAKLVDSGILSANEVRAVAGMPPLAKAA